MPQNIPSMIMIVNIAIITNAVQCHSFMTRVAGVGWLSARAKYSVRAFVERVFAKTSFFTIVLILVIFGCNSACDVVRTSN